MNDYVPSIAVEYRSGLTPFEPKIIQSLEVLQKIPSSFLEILTQQEVRIVYFNGPITQFPEFKSLAKSKKNNIHSHQGYSWDKVAGLCVGPPHGRAARLGDIYLGINGNYFTSAMTTIEETTIHELGHSIDHVVGRALFGEKLSSQWKFRKFKENVRKDGFSNKANLREHFAWFFEARYLQGRSGPLSSAYYPPLEKEADEYLAHRNRKE